MRPRGLLAHIASSSLAHVWGGKHDWAHVALFEKRHIAESQSDVTKHTAGASPTAFYLINQLWEDRKKRKKNKKIKNVHRQRALTQERTPTAGNPQKLQYMRAHTHTHTPVQHSQSHIFWQILIHPRKHTHQSQALFFFFLPRK